MERTGEMNPLHETATFGAGCFWGVEYTFRQVSGVLEAVSGYAGGSLENPTYEQVCSGTTGHAEVVQVTFNAAQVSYETLLDLFWQLHDPTQVNRQGPDVGTQYRSVAFCHSTLQQQLANASKLALEASGRLSRPVATQILPAPVFYPAEAYHQRYFEKHPHMAHFCHAPSGV
jgi:peptide-methionine (S)-S-oxide reductase